MDTPTLITRIKQDYLPDVSRTIILEYADTIQNLLFNHNCFNTTFLATADTTTVVPYPVMQTTAGVRDYKVIDANLSQAMTINGYSTLARVVSLVFIRSTTQYGYGLNEKYWQDEIDVLMPNPWSAYNATRTRFRKWPAAYIPRREIEPPRVVFFDDPGTTTDKYYLTIHLRPVPMTSESIPMSLDSDTYYDIVCDGIVGMWEEINNGSSDKYQKFLTVGRRKFWSEENQGDQGSPIQPMVHEC